VLLRTGTVRTAIPEPAMTVVEKFADIPIPAGTAADSVTEPEKPWSGTSEISKTDDNAGFDTLALMGTDNAKSGGNRFIVPVAQFAGAITLHAETVIV
jgi:hypothetical protein